MGPLCENAAEIRAIESACELVTAGHLALRRSLREGRLEHLVVIEAAAEPRLLTHYSLSLN